MCITGVLETVLYVDDLARARGFYGDLLGLKLVSDDPQRHLFFRCGPGMFLVFDRRGLQPPAPQVNGVPIPLHAATGPMHVAFRVETAGELQEWHARLLRAGITVEAEIEWPAGGQSLYVRDPFGHSIEFATPALWQLDPT